MNAQEVIDHFVRSPEARSTLSNWRRRRPEVAARVLGHDSRAVYSLTPDDVLKVCTLTEHALADTRYSPNPIHDWNPDFAFAHLFHFCTEELRTLPTFQEFRFWSERNPTLLHTPALREIARITS